MRYYPTLQTYIKVKEQLVVRQDMDVNYPTLHLDIYSSKGTACSKTGYGCK